MGKNANFWSLLASENFKAINFEIESAIEVRAEANIRNQVPIDILKIKEKFRSLVKRTAINEATKRSKLT